MLAVTNPTVLQYSCADGPAFVSRTDRKSTGDVGPYGAARVATTTRRAASGGASSPPLSNEVIEFLTLAAAEISRKAQLEILGLHESPQLLIALRSHHPKHERLKLLDVLVVDDQVDAEPIPALVMPIPQMLLQPCTKIPRQSDVVEPLLLIKCIDAVASAHVLPDYSSVLLKEFR